MCSDCHRGDYCHLPYIFFQLVSVTVFNLQITHIWFVKALTALDATASECLHVITFIPAGVEMEAFSSPRRSKITLRE